MSLERVRTVVTETVTVVRARQVGFMAAAIAYYALVSVFPLLLLALAVASFLGGSDLADGVVAGAGDALSPVARDLVYDTLASASGRGGATLFGLVVLVWSGLRLFRGLDVAFAAVYGTPVSKSLVARSTDALVVLFGVSVGVVAVTGVNVLTASVTPVTGVVVGLLGVFVGALVFFPVYYLVPDVPMAPRDALPGTAVAAVGWATLAQLYRAYAAVAGGFELYGVVGGVLLLVTWFYLGAMVVLVGATVNAVVAGRAVDRQVQHPPRRQNR